MQAVEGMNETLDPVSRPSLPGVFSHAELEAMRACRVLIIDDELPNVQLLERVLSRGGFQNFISTTDSREVAHLFRDFDPDLVLTDWLMPEVNGLAVVALVRAAIASDDYLPIVVLTADITLAAKKQALAAGATDFLTKPFDQIEVLLRIQNLLKARLSHLTILRQNAALEESVRNRTLELERALTELRSTQSQVIQQERLAALGAMAGGIAHDFNNALSIIMGFSEILLRDLETGLRKEVAAPQLTTILTAAEDAATIVHRLREFYRPDATSEQRLPVDVNELIEQAAGLTQPRWQTDALANGRTIEMVIDPGKIPCILADAGELRELLINIIFNAADALPQGGRITLRTRPEEKGILLTISDTGTGMSPEVRRRCLEPFFTTKGERGTGLGLSMVFGIVQRHQGSIDIESEPGKGTTFALRLPAAGVVSVEMRAAPQQHQNPLQILVVDDQPILRELLCEYLQGDLHTVESAGSAREALEKFAAGSFDLVITDQVMSEMNGDELATAIKEVDPNTPVILLTGYVGDTTADRDSPSAIDLVLSKPLSRADLRRGLAQVMHAS